MTSVHATSAREALRKLTTLPLLAGENVDREFVAATVAACVDLVVFCRRIDDARVVTEILAVGEPGGDGVEATAGLIFEGMRDGSRVDRRGAPSRRALRRVRHRPPGDPAMSVLAVLFGLGVFLVYDACTSEPRVRRSRDVDRPGRAAARFFSRRAIPGSRSANSCSPRSARLSVRMVVVLAMFGSPTIAVLAGGGGVVCAGRVPSSAAPRAAAVRSASAGPRPSSSSPERCGPVTRSPPRSRWSPRRVPRLCDRPSGRWSPITGCRATSPAPSIDPRSCSRIRLRIVSWSRSSVAHRVGGRELGRVLRTLAAFLREDLAVRKEVEARQSWTVVAARVAAAAPWVVLVLVASRPQGRAAFDSFQGMVVLVAGAVATIVGYRMMLTLGRLPEEPRVLGGDGVNPTRRGRRSSRVGVGGVACAISALPGLRRPRLSNRLDAYLGSLGPRRSPLLAPDVAVRGAIGTAFRPLLDRLGRAPAAASR